MEFYELVFGMASTAAPLYLFRQGSNLTMKRFIKYVANPDLRAAFNASIETCETDCLLTRDFLNSAKKRHLKLKFLCSKFNPFISKDLRNEYGWMRSLILESTLEFEAKTGGTNPFSSEPYGQHQQEDF